MRYVRGPVEKQTGAMVLFAMKALKWERPRLVELAAERVAAAALPKFVVCGGWSNGFEAWWTAWQRKSAPRESCWSAPVAPCGATLRNLTPS